MKLDVCITATVRPEVLKITLQNFTKNLLNQFDCRAIINVDPAGDTKNYSQTDVVNLAREYFSEVVYRTPNTASFAGAVKWCWKQVKTDLFFHLEDDWILKQAVNGNVVLNRFDNLEVVSFSFNRLNRQQTQAQIDNGVLIKLSDSILQRYSFVLGPGFMRTKYFKKLAEVMSLNKDPEFQYVSNRNKLIVSDYPKPVFLIDGKHLRLVMDTGQIWRKTRSLKKVSRAEVRGFRRNKDGLYPKSESRLNGESLSGFGKLGTANETTDNSKKSTQMVIKSCAPCRKPFGGEQCAFINYLTNSS